MGARIFDVLDNCFDRVMLPRMNWKDFFDSLGMNGTKWQWRIMRWQRAWTDRSEGVRQKKEQVTYQHKFCRSCNALIDREEKVCPHCGARAPSWRVQVVQRALGLAVPSGFSVSAALLLMNALMFLLLVAVDGSSALMAPSSEWLVRLGGLVPRFVAQGDYGRLITYGYLHLGLIHFGFNMLVLSQVGPMLENEIGRSRFFCLYTLCIIGGGVARLYVSGPVIMLVVGASGGLFGLIGFGVAFAHLRGGPEGYDLRHFFLRWAVLGFIFGFIAHADNVAHFGGFVVGAALGWVMGSETIQAARRRSTNALWNSAAWILFGLTVVAFGWLFVA